MPPNRTKRSTRKGNCLNLLQNERKAKWDEWLFNFDPPTGHHIHWEERGFQIHLLISDKFADIAHSYRCHWCNNLLPHDQAMFIQQLTTNYKLGSRCGCRVCVSERRLPPETSPAYDLIVNQFMIASNRLYWNFSPNHQVRRVWYGAKYPFLRVMYFRREQPHWRACEWCNWGAKHFPY